jgi:hypothetical protein
MGATVTTGKLAAAFKAPNGESFFVLFEETFEKNVRPFRPAWHCVAIGPIASVMERVFAYGSGCEGGALQGRNGWITPEGYIAGWLKELANPVAMADISITLAQGTGFYDVVNPGNREAVCAAATSAGRADISDAIVAGGSPAIHLHADADLVLALNRAGVLVWRLIQCPAPVWGFRDPSLGYSPKPVRASADALPSFLKVDDNVRLMRRDDGSWVNRGWEYAIVQDFISDLWQAELREPGTYRKRIGAFRDAARSCPMIPAGTRIDVDLSRELEHDWQRRDVEKLRGEVDATPTSTGFSFPFPADDTLRYRACQLPSACTVWCIPVAASGLAVASQQLSLLDA